MTTPLVSGGQLTANPALRPVHDSAMAHNESHVCDVALSPTRAKGHVAERRAAAPRSPSRPEGAAMYIRAVMRSCAMFFDLFLSATAPNEVIIDRCSVSYS
jgi:hypothetical protein